MATPQSHSTPVSRRSAIALGTLATGSLLTGAFSSRVPAALNTALYAEETPRTPIRIGQIGVGHAHATKLAVYRRSPDYEVVGIAEPDDQLWQAEAQHPAFHGLPRLSIDQLLHQPGLQAVLVETRIPDLLTTAETCLNAGMHIHLDKPAGTSFPHFQRVMRLATERRRLVQLGYMYRYNPGFLLLRDFLRHGWLGDIFEVHGVVSKVVEPPLRREFALYPGGILFELGGHVLDLILAILGRPTRTIPINRRSGRFGDDLLDNTLTVLEYPQASATLRCTALEVDGGQRRHLTVCGTEGTLHIQPLDGHAARLTLSQPRENHPAGTHDLVLNPYTRYTGDAADMARILRNEKPHDYPPDHDLLVQEILLTASNMPLT